MKIVKQVLRMILKTIKWIFITIIGLLIISALYNLTLPKKSKIVEQLSADEKAYIAETMNLQQKMGNNIMPGWGDLQIPVIVYNEKYAFLVGLSDPSDGWFKMPAEEFRGAKWEPVENDNIFGQTYYRQSLTSSGITPENFTVKVGDRWVATMQTKEFAAVEFYNGFKNALPPVVNAIFPYKLFWNLLMGKAEAYIGGIAHEAFHAYQGNEVIEKFTLCETASQLASDYPWENSDNAAGWIEETNLLIAAYNAQSNEETKSLVAQFLDKRNERRQRAMLTTEMIQYEQKREWLEGLAKYAELNICLAAQESDSYSSIDPIRKVSGFSNYKNSTGHFQRQVDEVARAADRPGESRFYYGGMLQAEILDKLMPEWKNDVFVNQIYLEDLLRKCRN